MSQKENGKESIVADYESETQEPVPEASQRDATGISIEEIGSGDVESPTQSTIEDGKKATEEASVQQTPSTESKEMEEETVKEKQPKKSALKKPKEVPETKDGEDSEATEGEEEEEKEKEKPVKKRKKTAKKSEKPRKKRASKYKDSDGEETEKKDETDETKDEIEEPKEKKAKKTKSKKAKTSKKKSSDKNSKTVSISSDLPPAKRHQKRKGAQNESGHYMSSAVRGRHIKRLALLAFVPRISKSVKPYILADQHLTNVRLAKRILGIVRSRNEKTIRGRDVELASCMMGLPITGASDVYIKARKPRDIKNKPKAKSKKGKKASKSAEAAEEVEAEVAKEVEVVEKDKQTVDDVN